MKRRHKQKSAIHEFPGEEKHEAHCTVVLVRHAASNGAGCFVGQNDEPLSVVGRDQLKLLVAKLSGFTFQAAFASDLQRAQATAIEAVRHLGLDLQIRPRLREMHFGCWQGLSWDRITKRNPRLARLWLKRFPSQKIPGAESFVRFKERVKVAVQEIVRENPDRCVLVVTHAGVIRVALAEALGIKDRNSFRFTQDACAVNVIDYFESGAAVRCVNA